jgi:enoyl-CoA hydratase/carnithine racemase
MRQRGVARPEPAAETERHRQPIARCGARERDARAIRGASNGDLRPWLMFQRRSRSCRAVRAGRGGSVPSLSHAAFASIRHGQIPTVAALHGATVGGGLELAAACHIRVADTTAFFALPEGMRGIYVGGGASVHVARLLGAARMADMMLTGRVLDADTAERTGLVQYVVPNGEARAKAAELAAKIAAMARLTVLGVLHALPRIQDMSEADGLFVESLMAALAASGTEAAARLADFVEKRGAKVTPPSESLVTASQVAAASIAGPADIDPATAAQFPQTDRRMPDGA